MSNNYNIPEELEKKIRKRDKRCVYCRVKMKPYTRQKGKNKATIEHFNNDGPYDKEWNIAICCNSCNSSKGTKKLMAWLESPPWKKKNISKSKLAPSVRRYLKRR